MRCGAVAVASGGLSNGRGHNTAGGHQHTGQEPTAGWGSTRGTRPPQGGTQHHGGGAGGHHTAGGTSTQGGSLPPANTMQKQCSHCEDSTRADRDRQKQMMNGRRLNSYSPDVRCGQG